LGLRIGVVRTPRKSDVMCMFDEENVYMRYGKNVKYWNRINTLILMADDDYSHMVSHNQ
jgi:hypothetical protein